MRVDKLYPRDKLIPQIFLDNLKGYEIRGDICFEVISYFLVLFEEGFLAVFVEELELFEEMEF